MFSGKSRSDIKKTLFSRLDDEQPMEIASDKLNRIFLLYPDRLEVIDKDIALKEAQEQNEDKKKDKSRPASFEAANLKTFKLHKSKKGEYSFKAMYLTPNGTILLHAQNSESARNDRLVLGRLTSKKQFKVSEEVLKFKHPIELVRWNAAGDRVLIGLKSGELHYWNVKTNLRTSLQVFDNESDRERSMLTSVRFVDDRTFIIANGFAGQLAKVSLKSDDSLKTDWMKYDKSHFTSIEDSTLQVVGSHIVYQMTEPTDDDAYTYYQETNDFEGTDKSYGVRVLDLDTGNVQNTLGVDYRITILKMLDKHSIVFADEMMNVNTLNLDDPDKYLNVPLDRGAHEYAIDKILVLNPHWVVATDETNVSIIHLDNPSNSHSYRIGQYRTSNLASRTRLNLIAHLEFGEFFGILGSRRSGGFYGWHILDKKLDEVMRKTAEHRKDNFTGVKDVDYEDAEPLNLGML